MTTRATSRGMPDLLMPDSVLHNTSVGLCRHFDGVFSPETVERYVAASYVALRRTARVQAHLTVLAGRFALDRLTALAQAQGVVAKEIPEILLVCVHNAGRSQLAAALLDHHAAGRVHVRSAGSAPGVEVDANVLAALAEVGVDASDAFPKPLTDDVVRAADVVVTMGCGDACPVYEGRRYLDWQLADPHGMDLDGVRRVRDEIEARVRHLLAELVATRA